MDGLKQRIIGAAVLISLAVIFIPMLFDSPHDDRSSKVVPIPDKPMLPTITIEPPKPLNLPVDTPAPQPAAADDATTGVAADTAATAPAAATVDARTTAAEEPAKTAAPTNTTAVAVAEKPAPAAAAQPAATTKPEANTDAAALAKQPALNDKGAVDAWTVQIGTFKNRANAYALRDKLRSQGFKGYTQDISTKDGTMVRVFAGPLSSNEEAQQYKAKVSQAIGSNGLVVHYSP